MHALSRLSDEELVAHVSRLAGAEREATASLIAHLAELYARRLHERAGFASLFTFCVGALGMSEHEAYDRMTAARVVRRYPAVLGMIASGQATLTGVRLLAPHLTHGNHRELFAATAGLGKRQIQELVAARFPEADVATSVRELPPSPGFTPTPPPLVRPLSPGRYLITFTASAQTRAKLELAQDLLRHAIPSGDPALVFSRALDALVEELVRAKYAVTEHPRARRAAGEDDGRYIPAEVKRAVFIRDRGRCVFVGSDGRCCGERAFVEFHHVVPYAAGGRSTVDNIQLRCRAHNHYESAVFLASTRGALQPS